MKSETKLILLWFLFVSGIIAYVYNVTKSEPLMQLDAQEFNQNK